MQVARNALELFLAGEREEHKGRTPQAGSRNHPWDRWSVSPLCWRATIKKKDFGKKRNHPWDRWSVSPLCWRAICVYRSLSPLSLGVPYVYVYVCVFVYVYIGLSLLCQKGSFPLVIQVADDGPCWRTGKVFVGDLLERSGGIDLFDADPATIQEAV